MSRFLPCYHLSMRLMLRVDSSCSICVITPPSVLLLTNMGRKQGMRAYVRPSASMKAPYQRGSIMLDMEAYPVVEGLQLKIPVSESASSSQMV